MSRFKRIIVVGIILLGVTAVLFVLAVGGARILRGKLGYRTTARSSEKLHLTGSQPYNHFSNAQTYRLRIYGKVGREITLTIDDVKALKSAEIDAPLDCVVGWTDRARWKGVAIRDIIALALPDKKARFALLRDDRNYSASLSLDYIATGKPILAYEVNGKPLPAEQGWPLRVAAPDKWGYKWVKWVKEIEITDRGYEGTYESTGYSLNGNRNEPMLESDKHPERIPPAK
jgi:DMSO/TMAO reductase YedYZ molybdopterin-dependent catalytic subunit